MFSFPLTCLALGAFVIESLSYRTIKERESLANFLGVGEYLPTQICAVLAERSEGIWKWHIAILF